MIDEVAEGEGGEVYGMEVVASTVEEGVYAACDEGGGGAEDGSAASVEMGSYPQSSPIGQQPPRVQYVPESQ